MHTKQTNKARAFLYLMVGCLSSAVFLGCERNNREISSEKIKKDILKDYIKVDSCYASILRFDKIDKLVVLESYEDRNSAKVRITIDATMESNDKDYYCYKCVFSGKLRLSYGRSSYSEDKSGWALNNVENLTFKPIGRENETTPESFTKSSASPTITPNSVESPSTPMAEPTPPVIRVPSWAGFTVRTLCLKVKSSYPRLPQSQSSEAEHAKTILTSMGINIAQDGDSCEATLNISTSGEASSQLYTSTDLGRFPVRCFTGAEVTSIISLESDGKPPIEVSFNKRIPTPYMPGNCPPDAASAPFDKLWKYTLHKTIIYLWGPRPFFNIFKYESNKPLVYDGFYAFEDSDANTATEIVSELKDPNLNVRINVLRSLLPNKNAQTAFTEGLSNENALVSECSEVALKFLTKPVIIKAPEPSMQWWDTNSK